MAPDIEFRNATVIDGSSGDPYAASVAVKGSRVVAVDDSPIGAGRVVDVDGAVVAPGFVDMHAHSELRLFDHPGNAEKLTQGFTLEVCGQDGVSVAPVRDDHIDEWASNVQALLGTKRDWEWNAVGEFLDSLNGADPATNIAYYAPHGNLRSLAAGFEDRELTDDELTSMQASLATAIDEGAFAMSKGMIYPPSSYGRDDEFVTLAETLGERDTFMISHVWNETDYVVESIERYIDICERGGCQPHVSHLKVGGEENWGRSEAVLDVFDAANERGTDVTFDQYPYTAGSTMLTALLPPWARDGDDDATLERVRDPDARQEMATDIRSDEGKWENLARAAGTWDNILITRTGSGAYEGHTVADIAAERDDEPIEVLFDILAEEALDVTMADFIMDEGDIERFLADERGTVCSDGIFGGKPHPRVIGTGARVLERYVNEREVLDLPTAIYKLAGYPADILGLPDRGRVAEGYIADLVVFDPGAVAERATYEDPRNLSRGMEFVLIDGEVVVEDGIPTGKRPGEVLRSTEVWAGDRRPTLRSRT
jgi:N-acyl-D-amino-acid deacylase